jgi:hypothetical protein
MHIAEPFFTCPTTRQKVPTGIETDVQSLRAAWSKTLKVQCPHCGETHEFSVRETYIEAALDGAGLPGKRWRLLRRRARPAASREAAQARRGPIWQRKRQPSSGGSIQRQYPNAEVVVRNLREGNQ